MSFSTFVTETAADPTTMKRAVIAPGRYNPPHLGHKGIINKLTELGKELDAIPVVIVIDSGKRDEKNPLDGQLRKEYLRKMFPKIQIVVAHNPYDAIVELGEQSNLLPVGGVTGADRGNTYKKMIGRIYGREVEQQYRAEVVHRDPDAGDVAGISATKVRAAAAANDIPKVMTYTGLSRTESVQLISRINDAKPVQG